MAMRIKFGAPIINQNWSRRFFFVRAESLFTLRTFGAQINLRVISMKVLFDLAGESGKGITFLNGKRHVQNKNQKWTSIATVQDLCPTTVKILTHLISRYHLPLRNSSKQRILQNSVLATIKKHDILLSSRAFYRELFAFLCSFWTRMWVGFLLVQAEICPAGVGTLTRLAIHVMARV